MTIARKKTYQILFQSNTKAGRRFDTLLLILILISALGFILESVSSIQTLFPLGFRVLDWTLTLVFTLEYILRLWSSPKRSSYAFSLLGVIDLLAILPTLAGLVIESLQFLAIIRILRLMRVFRVLKLVRFMGEADHLKKVLKASSSKIFVFLSFVTVFCVFVGTLMFVVEGPTNGFTDIPRSIYWSIVTLTTVGYGDIAPQTPLGQFLSVLLMITGYGIIAIPTGLVSAEMVRSQSKVKEHLCPSCQSGGHQSSAKFCHHCGHPL